MTDDMGTSASLRMHEAWQGKVEVVSRVRLDDPETLAIAYTPGVAEPCLEISRDPEECWRYTRRGNLVAVITDGSAVLGLGDIGPVAGMPVMEGKCALFKAFADIDAFPLCVDTHDVDEIVRCVQLISGSFGGINLEDIAAPRCFEIERRLKEVCDIPVFHDDQHGTAVVTCAALRNACRVTGRDISQVRVVISGAGAAGASIANLMLRMGVTDITLSDIDGVVYAGRPGLSGMLAQLAERTNPRDLRGTLADAMVDADVFVGVSAPGIVSRDMVRSMHAEPIVFSMANPVPEIMPDEALAAGAAIVATGRSDYPNQINNLLAFPGIFKGALAVRARDITQDMLVAAADAIAGLVGDDAKRDLIIPSPFDERVVPAVSNAVMACARETGQARR
ncbi:NAD(P)-dependent malic enzyme [Enorma phocaeensis]|uniref:NAD(P)-dependent malic enzyme n=1 Tax=Enorma phocaeensis TaxID=1871019 RepID=UPI001FE5E5F7|nr:NADP-dependent malic enzyme [Enorma phocaeensis]